MRQGVVKEVESGQTFMEEFKDPPRQYRGAPFWAWNCQMTKEKVDVSLQTLKDMGMGGAFFHCRTGMAIPYLGEEFMEITRYAHEKAEQLGLFTCLYDEDRWPSGYGGGYVTRQEKYRSRYLVFSPEELPLVEKVEPVVYKSSAEPVPSGKRTFLASYRVRLSGGFLANYDRLAGNPVSNGKEQDKSGKNQSMQRMGEEDHEWYAYLEVSGDHPWFNNQAYVDTLNPEAVAEFIRITYEAYEKELGEAFGKEIPYIFTDEPQFSFKTQLGYAGEEKRVTIPYTDDFEESFRAAYGDSFLDHLPEIFWELPAGRVSVIRYRYHDHVCERFTRAYSDQIGAWCRDHHIRLTGHMMREPFLEGQTMALGEAMRAYRSFDLPGIDMLCDRRELTTAKQAQSAAHQFDRPGIMSELYGVTGWDFDFRGHKLAGDWQAALGVTLRVHHLTWTSMAGEAKRDYPASIGSQSPWYREYPVLENYFARLNTVLRRGRPVVKIGVIHPIESYWLYWGPREQTQDRREEMEERFGSLVSWLLYGLLDFDFISESLLEEWEQNEEEGFRAGAMCYDAILVPGCVTLRSHTLHRLGEFADRGGRVIFAGEIPAMVDALPDERATCLARRCVTAPFSCRKILESLEPERLLDIRDQEGKRPGRILYQMRREGETRILFLSHAEKTANPDLAEREDYAISVKGCWSVTRLLPEDGTTQSIDCRRRRGGKRWEEETTWRFSCYEHDSFLYLLEAAGGVTDHENEERNESKEPANAPQQLGMARRAECAEAQRLPAFPRVPVLLDEPNVLPLDMAEYAFDEEAWQGVEEILRIDNQFRRKLGLPLRAEAFAQPWTMKMDGREETHRLRLRFTIFSACDIDGISAGLEWDEAMALRWNGEMVRPAGNDWYVDRDIRRIKLPALKKGENCLELSMPFHSRCHTETVYLLGDFGVEVMGRSLRIREPVRELGFGDICMQGLPFYGGTVRYQVPIETMRKDESFLISTTYFRCPAIAVSLDGQRQGIIMCSPYEVTVVCPSPGTHVLEFAAYGNRRNTFGPLHNCNQTEQWIGPDAWRTRGVSWAYEYQLKPAGILKSPLIQRAEPEGQEVTYDSIYGK